ncbi:hypothetical protein BDN71DRAFT_1431115 [Pleurotus eryngii]|uniref:Fungal-type protein kinase domain-containing protein n=1 Tax=Pleurotus eryngii TaxID=5323 RepID=A0A9P5ZXZ4_PLEER|nr:hypothetical protein BDN71DRAFT_1431115 [Pleurotus eryngii]
MAAGSCRNISRKKKPAAVLYHRADAEMLFSGGFDNLETVARCPQHNRIDPVELDSCLTCVVEFFHRVDQGPFVKVEGEAESNPACYVRTNEDQQFYVNDEFYSYAAPRARGKDPYANMKSFAPSLSVDSIPLASPRLSTPLRPANPVPLADPNVGDGGSHSGSGTTDRYLPPHPYGAQGFYTSHLNFDDDDDDGTIEIPPSHTASYSSTYSTSHSGHHSRPDRQHDPDQGEKRARKERRHSQKDGYLAPTKSFPSPSREQVGYSQNAYDPQSSRGTVRPGRSASHSGTIRPQLNYSSFQRSTARKVPGIMKFASEQHLPRQSVHFVAQVEPERRPSRTRQEPLGDEKKGTWRMSLTYDLYPSLPPALQKRIRKASRQVKSFFGGRLLKSQSMPSFPTSGYYDDPHAGSVRERNAVTAPLVICGTEPSSKGLTNLACFLRTHSDLLRWNYQAQRDDFETNGRVIMMSGEMTGNWVGPCPVRYFFNLTMPLVENAKETLADITTTFFAGFQPKNEQDVYKKMTQFFGNSNPPHFPGIKMVDTSAHPDFKPGAKVKPDMCVYHEQLRIKSTAPTHLANALTGVEADEYVEIFDDSTDPRVVTMEDEPFEVDTDGAILARGQLVTYAAEFCVRQHRTHMFLVYVYFPYARLIRFDRSGALVSQRFDFVKDCTPLNRFFSRFCRMDNIAVGYDLTVHVANEAEAKFARKHLAVWAPTPKLERPVFKMDVYDDRSGQARQFLVWGSLADPESPLGRATRGYPAIEITNGLLDDTKPMFLKEQWRSLALGPEIETIRKMNKAGVHYVPTLVCGGDLPNQLTKTQDYASMFDGRIGDKRLDLRQHMLRAVGHALQGHKEAYELCGLLHRDVSGGNILIQGDGTGLLNDWDTAVVEKDIQDSPRAHERTGTWAFMSIAMLKRERRPHGVCDDLESFLWVILYYSLSYLPHNRVKDLDFIIQVIFEQYDWSHKGGSGKRDFIMFGEHIGDRDERPLEFTGNLVLTEFVKKMVAVFRARYSFLMMRPQESAQMMHKDVQPFWDEALDSIWPENDAATMQRVLKKTAVKRAGPDHDDDSGGQSKEKKLKTCA